jgi:hypothetical protein
MPGEVGAASTSDGIAFLVAAGIMAEIIAKACSSPQTTELNAGTRAPTLMKWVTIGIVEGAFFVIVAGWIDPRHRKAILAGGILEGAITFAEYAHGKKAGLASRQPGTEQ